MSIFDYPRINFQGQINLNPGTANNADYAQGLYYNGQPLTLIDPSMVEPNTYGMSDPDFIEWVQQKHQFTDKDGNPSGSPIFPSEWNYYGPMTMQISAADNTTIIGIQTDREHSYTSVDPNIPITSLLSKAITLSGHMTDVNSEGSPPATQFFIDSMSIGGDTITGFSKGVGQWLNFFRNINLTADGGAGAYVYHVIPKSQIGDLSKYFTGRGLDGIICRYYLYRPMLGSATEKMYANKQQNPAPIEIIGTFAPWNSGEDITTVPVGRLLLSDKQDIATPAGVTNNGNSFGTKNGNVALAPAVVRAIGNSVSIDCLSTFPDYYQQGNTPENPKYNFGIVNLMVTNGTDSALVGNIPYAAVIAGTNVQKGDANGWVFNFDILDNTEARSILANPETATFYLDNEGKNVLQETDHYFVTNQSAVYGEQGGSATEFWNERNAEAVKVAVYSRGQRLSPNACPDISIWQYKSVPLQSPGNKELITSVQRPGQPIDISTDQPGSFVLTFGINRPPSFPPESYNTFSIPPFVTNAPQISLRILPNNVDFSQYYENPDAPEDERIGNDQLTFDVVFQHSLRTYWLLYPAMKTAFDLNDCRAVAQNASGILYVTDPANWMKVQYMPRTRDLSLSRRTLLRAWCRKVLKEGVDNACPDCQS